MPTAVEQSSRLHAREKDKGEAEQRTTASISTALGLSVCVLVLGRGKPVRPGWETKHYPLLDDTEIVHGEVDPHSNRVKGCSNDQAVNFQSDPSQATSRMQM